MSNNIQVGSPYLGGTRNPFNYEKFEQLERDVSTAWLTMEDVTQQLNLFDDESQDVYLSSLELATRMAIEDLIGLTIFPIKYRVYYGTSGTATGSQMSLDLPEVSQDNGASLGVTINSVGYWNGDDIPLFVELSIGDYYYDPTGNKVIVNSGLPSEINNIMTSPIVVDYTTGASPLASYPVIKQAGLLLLTHLYNNRSNSNNTMMYDIPFGVNALLRPYKPLVL